MSRTGPRSLTLLAAVTAGVLLLAACGGTGTKTTASGTDGGKPVQGGSLTYATDTEPISFDIHVSQQDATGAIQRNVFDSLVHQDAKGDFQPWLATSWDIAPDFTSYTFHLRPGVKFTDGTPFDANAVKVNFDRIVAKDTKSQYAASLLGPYTGSQVIDAQTVKVSFSKPFAPFLQAASTAYLGFYSPKAIAENGTKLGQGGPVDVGTGPFIFSSYTKGQSAVFTRNPDYDWAPKDAAHQGPAYLDKLTVRFLTEDSVRVGALQSGQVQVADPIPPADVKSVQGDSRLRTVSTQAPGANYALVLNTTKTPLNDPLVRQAVQRGIDVDTDVKSVYFGVNQRAWSPLSPTTPDYDKSLENSWPYDPALANKDLDQAGWTGRDAQGYRTKDGQRLTLEWPLPPAEYVREQRDTLGQAIQADLKKVGIEVTRPRQDIGTYIANTYGGKEAIADYSWARFDPDVLRLYFNSASSPATGGENATFYQDSQLDTWTNTGEATLDAATRQDVYGKTQQRAIDLGLIVPLYVRTDVVGATSQVHGLTADPNTWLNFHDAWLAK
ncbi:ABC transporter substrate-binding protein [Kitasatospora sp. NBC_01287]|uniref:ABC transporter substrate-binding protein n=1 Tax=Kitasatospora sp. NBC_01287 TaxID=2903573 RepID=UPI0022590409|nr:ABC transporter substrate-binding protein [Kitasatospora sp. NBC_01287]MCX4745003.1 ABC transporter substrate-binding protein [Kitasatospora sp. NBC_01287]